MARSSISWIRFSIIQRSRNVIRRRRSTVSTNWTGRRKPRVRRRTFESRRPKIGRGKMSRTVGVLVMEHIAVGLVENHKVIGALNIFPEAAQSLDPLQSMPAEGVVDC